MKRLLKMLMPVLSKGKLLKYIFLGLISGLFSFLFVNMITRVISLIIAGNFTANSGEYVIVFASIVLLFIWSRRTLSLAITGLSQTFFWSLRKQIISSVLNANYQQLTERKNKVSAAILSDVHILMEASLSLILFITSSILGISCLIYLLSISLYLFLITLGIALLGIVAYRFSSNRNIRQFQKSRKLENDFQQNLNDILNGYKEIYMDPRKGWSIYNKKISEIAGSSYANNMGAFTGYINNQITGQVLFYVLIASVLLFFSGVLKIKPGDTVSFVFTLLYLLSSIESVMVLLPGLVRARVAANELMSLKEELAGAKFTGRTPEKYVSREEFDQITVRHLAYHYGAEEGSFGIGPIDLDIRKGETLFIYGGNGSGKTTFINALIGLYVPQAGEIRYNGHPVDSRNYPDYGTLFSVVFSDFYLFNEILWLDDIDMEKWDYYLDLFEIEGKVTIEGGRLSTTDLSTGQRKRLALIVSLLEGKPVLVIDEWAADQDPNFRKKFYTEIIPLLKKEGITIIAITHDDRFYHCADKLYKMEYGKLLEESINVYELSVTA
jgi:putative pyoverdin transport system ATP-binding/permease protein